MSGAVVHCIGIIHSLRGGSQMLRFLVEPPGFTGAAGGNGLGPKLVTIRFQRGDVDPSNANGPETAVAYPLAGKQEFPIMYTSLTERSSPMVASMNSSSERRCRGSSVTIASIRWAMAGVA